MRGIRTALLAAFVLGVTSLPAGATSIVIDSSNCSSPTACYGLSWGLTINTVSVVVNGVTYGYQALLTVTDDAAVSGTPSVVISAVSFKVSDSISAARLYTVPGSTVLSTWTTTLNNLNSKGCGGSGAGFACSSSASDPANFTASTSPQIWGWYFNTASGLFPALDGAHIGAKMTTLNRPGQLLSESYTAPVPEPSTLSALGGIAVGLLATRYRRRRAQAS